ncbi:DUF6636 domain-containing protein [Mycobacterium seoulense]|uniref:DUF6636 domain-containing protein n=1 Tax=Mycobacterium seoulense TaxID=386911 RepID=UPI003CEEC981
MTITMKASTAALIATIALAPPARADDGGVFLSPSGNIICSMAAGPDAKTGATCEIRDHTYVPPEPTAPTCHLARGDRVSLFQGSAPVLNCHGDTEFGLAAGQPTLPYGQTRTVGTVTCDSEPNGIICTDDSTGHYFRISRESLDLG